MTYLLLRQIRVVTLFICMRQDFRPIVEAMLAILRDPRANRIERIECAKVLLSCYGQLLPDVNEDFLSVRQITQLRRAKQDIVERVLKKKAARKRQNRRAFLRRKIKSLEAQQPNNNGELNEQID